MNNKTTIVKQVLSRLVINNVKVRLHIINNTETVALIWAGGYSVEEMGLLVSPMVAGVPLVFFRK